MDFQNAVRTYLDELLFCEKGIISTEQKTMLNTIRPVDSFFMSQAPEGFLYEKPLFASWHVTSACNQRCRHCFYNETDYSNLNDLSRDEALALATELTDELEVLKVIITGGEPFLRKDLLELFRKFKTGNVSIFVQTNSTLITDEQIYEMADLFSPYLDVVQVSLDASNSETYRKIRRSDDFDRVVSVIKKLVQNDIRVSVNATVNRLNLDEIFDIYRLVSDLGVMDFAVSKLQCFNEKHKSLEADIEDLVVLAAKLTKCLDNNSGTFLALNLLTPIDLINNQKIRNILKEKKYIDAINRIPFPSNCSCNRHDRLNIQSDGRVYMCMAAECEGGLVGEFRKNSLVDIWNSRFLNPLYNPREIDKMSCRTCDFFKLCRGGCVGRAFFKYGDINMPDSFCMK